MATRKEEQTTDKPAPPKKPMSAYFLFTNDMREKYKTKYPGKKVTELAKLMSEGYREMSEKERQTFEERAKKLKEAYEKDIAAYVAKYGPIPKKERRSPDSDKKNKKCRVDDNDDDSPKAINMQDRKQAKAKEENVKQRVKVGNGNVVKEKK